MLSNKRSRIFVSLLTLVICLGVLAVGTRAQGPTAADPSQVEAANTTVRTNESGSNPDNNIVVQKSVSNSTVIASGTEITYVVTISNTTNATATNVAFNDALPYNTRFNSISGADFIFSSSDYTARISPSTGITLSPGQSTQAVYVVEHNDAACNVPIENVATVTQGGKTYQATNTSVAYDQIGSLFEMEQANVVGAPIGGDSFTLNGLNFFTETSNELGWHHGVPISPTYLGAPGASQVWGTNLGGFYTDTNSAFADQTLTGTLDLTNIPNSGAPVYLSWQQYLDFLTGFNRAQVIIQDGSTSNTIYDTGTTANGIKATNGWELSSVDVRQYVGKKVLLIFRFTTDGNNINSVLGATKPHFGWYIDDLAVGSCNAPALTLNKVASTSPSSCTTSSVSGASSKKESKSGFSGLLVTPNTEVYYCFAVENTGNLTLTNHVLSDNKLRDGEIITGSTASDYPSSEVVALQTNGLAPLGVTNTFDLLRGTNITPTAVITQLTVNTATWSARFEDVDYYNIITDTNDKGYTTIASTGEALELKDDSELTVTLPFNFSLFDVNYTSGENVVVGNNGGLLFQNIISDVLPTNAPLPLTGTHGVSSTQGQGIFPLWDDWATGRVYSDVRGTSPNREWVIEWQVPHKLISGANPVFSTTNKVVFQAIMYETTNDVVFVYNDVTLDNATYSNGASATIGLSNRQAETRQYSFNRATLQDGLEVRIGKSIQETASASVGIQDAMVALSMTVSNDGTCSLSGMDTAKVIAGQNATVCYYLVNHGTVTMTHVSLTDTRIMGMNRLTNSDLTVDLGVYRNTNTLVFSDTFAPTDNMVINGASDVVASNKYPFRTSKNGGTTYNFTDIGFGSGANQGTKLTMNAQDNGEADVTMDFDFMYYGTVSNQIRVGNNGGLLFGVSGAGDVSPNNTKLGNAEHGLAIFPYWDTFEGEQGGVYHKTFGTAPNRRLVIQWDEIQHFDQSTDQGTFQAILYEGTNEIKFQYQDLDFGAHSPASNQTENFNFGASATVGLNHNANDAHEYSFNNEVQGSNISPTLNVTNSMAILWSPLNDATGSDRVTITVNYTPSIKLTKTVGTAQGVCATTDEITVTAGTTVYYCYTVENTGNTTFNSNTLHDDKLGLTVLFNSTQLTLEPGQITDTVSLGTSSLQAVITTDTLNTATWTAFSNPISRGIAVATDTAKVNTILPPTAVEIGELGVSRSSGLPLGSLVVGMLLLVAGGYVVHRRRMQ